MPGHVFIVGLPRTGAKLVRNILQSSRERNCCITLESFFMGRVLRHGVRQEIRRIGDVPVDASAHKLVEAMYSGQFFGNHW